MKAKQSGGGLDIGFQMIKALLNRQAREQSNWTDVFNRLKLASPEELTSLPKAVSLPKVAVIY